MNDYATIRPHLGLGDLRFGADFEEVRTYLGRPDAMGEQNSDTDWITWEYTTLGISVSFDPEYEDRLLSLTTERPDAVLNGHRLIGLTAETVLNRLQDYGLDKYEKYEPGEPLGWHAEFDNEDLEMVFNRYGDETVDQLKFISWRVHITKNDVVLWPWTKS